MKPALLDASAIVAMLDVSQESRGRTWWPSSSWKGALVTVEPVIAESCHLLRRVHGAPEAILQNVARNIFEIPFHLAGAAADIEPLFRKYRDQPISLADACLIHLKWRARHWRHLYPGPRLRGLPLQGRNRAFRLLVPLG